MADVVSLISKIFDLINPLKTPKNTLKTPPKLSNMILKPIKHIFYNSQLAKYWHEGTFRYGECFVYYFKKKD